MSRPLDVRFGPGLSGLLIRFQPDPLKVSYDSFEEYSLNSTLNGLNDFSEWPQTPTASFTVFWTSPYVDRTSYLSIYDLDTMETYTTVSGSSSLSGLSGGSVWGGAYVDKTSFFNYLLVTDDMESYSSGASLGGLNGGLSWSGSYVSH